MSQFSTPESPVAIVTGSTSGIGLAIAERLCQDGWRLVVNGRGERAAETADELVARGFPVVGVAADISEPTGAEALVDAAVESYGRLDALVNNAGIAGVGDSMELPLAAWERVLRVNLTGPFLCAQAAARPMSRSGGVIVNISSIFGHVGVARRAPYCASKHGLDGLTRVLAREWAQYGIRVLSVAPGFVDTPIAAAAAASGDELIAALQARLPIGRLAQPEEIASAVAYCVSSDASYLSGTRLVVDGGWLA